MIQARAGAVGPSTRGENVILFEDVRGLLEATYGRPSPIPLTRGMELADPTFGCSRHPSVLCAISTHGARYSLVWPAARIFLEASLGDHGVDIELSYFAASYRPDPPSL